MNLSDIKLKFNFNDKFNNLSRRLNKNSLLSFYYDTMAEDLYFDLLPDVVTNSKFFVHDFWMRRREDLHNRAKSVALCSKFWSGDYYRLQGVKDLQRVNLCHDRFCDNCQNTLAVQRSDKYEGVLKRFTENYDLFHVVLTVPNCSLEDLSSTLDKMFYSYKRFNIFLSGRLFVSGVDFLEIGYLGSIRALEITKNKNNNTFHPHFHCIWICKKGALKQKSVNVNLYSFKKYNSHIKRGSVVSNEPQRYFTDFEILVQKVWRLLYDGERVNYSNINELSLGYSCMIDNARGRYKEVFKYATKGLLSSEKGKDAVDTYSDFVLLFVTLYRRRLIQGYGCLYRMQFEDKIDTSPDDLYLEIVRQLHEVENPELFHEDLDMITKNIPSSNVTYISRKSIGHLGAKNG